jgi:cytochrome c55X
MTGKFGVPAGAPVFWRISGVSKLLNRFLQMAVCGPLFAAIFIPGPALADPPGIGAVAPVPARQAELLNMVRQDCGSCHGITLAGGLGLPLTPEALKGKSPEALVATILQGRAGTPMPPWNPFMTEAEAGWIVQMLMKGLPRDVP